METSEARCEAEYVVQAGSYLVVIDGEDSLVAHSEDVRVCVVDDAVGRVVAKDWDRAAIGSLVTVFYGSGMSSVQARVRKDRLRRLAAEVLPLDLDRVRAISERARS